MARKNSATTRKKTKADRRPAKSQASKKKTTKKPSPKQSTRTKKVVAKKITKNAAKYLVCDYCGTHNPLNAEECTQCNGKRFAPDFIKELRRVNRAVSVQVSAPHPLSKSESDVISLYKWWPNGRASFNIPNASQWEKIKAFIDDDLAKIIGWPTSKDVKKKVKEVDTSITLSQLAQQYPDKFDELIQAIGEGMELPVGEDGAKVFSAIGNLINKFDQASLGRITGLIEHLETAESTDIKKLNDLLGEWSVSQVTAVVREVTRRIATIDLLKDALKDEATYELKGDNSIHSILERDLWLLDENYWLIQSNKSLKTFIGDKLAERDKKTWGKKRPDFVCGSLGDTLIIAELKRPSHKLSVNDLNQLENYLAISEEYSESYKGHKAFLLGDSIPLDVKRHLKYRKGVSVITYWELLEKARARYDEYIKQKDKTESPVAKKAVKKKKVKKSPDKKSKKKK